MVRELTASRARIVAAADRERRRIEQDLHDGAQQRLVVLRIHLEVAAERAETNGTVEAETLRALGAEVDEALEERGQSMRSADDLVCALRLRWRALRALPLWCPQPAPPRPACRSEGSRCSGRCSVEIRYRCHRECRAVPVSGPEPSLASSEHIAGATAGVGSSDVGRRVLSGADVICIVRGQVEERLCAADEYGRLGEDDRAERLRLEAAVLRRYLP